ncbi:MAG: glycosyltransferase, partial [bacterium]|nr:glycosyltransferase [bacterium]
MRFGTHIAVIIPALNEEDAIGKVIDDVPEWVDNIVVVDNGSTDRTADVARGAGARVVPEAERGYGAACLAGIAALRDPDIVVFLDGDFSDHPEEMDSLVDPIREDQADMVIGSRSLGDRESGALTPQARFGNWLACLLMRHLWKASYTDLGPFRAIGFTSLLELEMKDRDYGWTVEMQVKAAAHGLRVRETPVRYRKRIGKSKISGTVRGVLGAGTKILSTIFSLAWRMKGQTR